MLLHGQPDSSASFWALRRALRQKLDGDVRIGLPDRPGYGANPLPATDFAGNTRWLRGWLDRFATGPVILVGHSWAGGIAALTAAEDESLPIAGVVLMASIGPYCLLPVDWALAWPVLGDLLAFATLGLGRRPISHHAVSVLGKHIGPADAPFAWASGAGMQHRPLWRSFLTEQRALIRQLPVIEDALGRVRVPTLVLAGRDDQVIPARTPQAIEELIPHAVGVRIAGGHDLQLRQPDVVADEISTFAAPLLSRPG